MQVSTARPIVFDRYTENRSTGSFILIDPATHFTCGAGMITESIRHAAAAQADSAFPEIRFLDQSSDFDDGAFTFLHLVEQIFRSVQAESTADRDFGAAPLGFGTGRDDKRSALRAARDRNPRRVLGDLLFCFLGRHRGNGRDEQEGGNCVLHETSLRRSARRQLGLGRSA